MKGASTRGFARQPLSGEERRDKEDTAEALRAGFRLDDSGYIPFIISIGSSSKIDSSRPMIPDLVAGVTLS
jgi:hypothetical protein